MTAAWEALYAAGRVESICACDVMPGDRLAHTTSPSGMVTVTEVWSASPSSTVLVFGTGDRRGRG